LMADLTETRPRFMIDSSAGVHRHFDKYPLEKFPPLRDWIEAHYIELESQIYVGHGFRVWVRSGANNPLAVDATGLRRLTQPSINTGTTLGPGRNRLGISAQTLDLNTRLTGIGLEVNGHVVAAIDLHSGVASRITVPIIIAPEAQSVSVRALARGEGGVWEASDPLQIAAVATTADAAQQTAFAIPLIAQSVPAIRLQAQFGARLSLDHARRTFAVHAPGVIEYDIPAAATILHGAFGLEEAAQAADNPHPSDGAEFVVRVRRSDGNNEVVFSRIIQPQLRPAETGEQGFRTSLPPRLPGDVLVLEINPGPAGDASSDWTYWRDLIFETSP
jgi:hypothetical protein